MSTSRRFFSPSFTRSHPFSVRGSGFSFPCALIQPPLNSSIKIKHARPEASLDASRPSPCSDSRRLLPCPCPVFLCAGFGAPAMAASSLCPLLFLATASLFLVARSLDLSSSAQPLLFLSLVCFQSSGAMALHFFPARELCVSQLCSSRVRCSSPLPRLPPCSLREPRAPHGRTWPDLLAEPLFFIFLCVAELGSRPVSSACSAPVSYGAWQPLPLFSSRPAVSFFSLPSSSLLALRYSLPAPGA